MSFWIVTSQLDRYIILSYEIKIDHFQLYMLWKKISPFSGRLHWGLDMKAVACCNWLECANAFLDGWMDGWVSRYLKDMPPSTSFQQMATPPCESNPTAGVSAWVALVHLFQCSPLFFLSFHPLCLSQTNQTNVIQTERDHDSRLNDIWCLNTFLI